MLLFSAFFLLLIRTSGFWMVDLQCQKQTHLVIHLELLRKPPLQETSKVAHSIIKANHTERMKVYVEVGCRHVLIAVQDTIKCMDFIICLGDSLTRVTEKVNDRWEVSVSLSDGHFQQIANHLVNIVNKQKKDANMKPHAVKNHLWVFVNALIDNPAFNSQTKETLTTRQVNFGSKCELSPEFLKKGVVDNLLSWVDFKQNKELKKTDGTRTGGRISVIKKLEEANLAGKAKAGEWTLILTEGDSAKALAKAGISVVGSNTYGVFPLRGKLLNVREACHKQIMDNAEIQHIKRVLGLQQGKQYDSVKGLRYGHLMIMTDQDHDGSHIKGLLINLFHTFWPSLLKVLSFLVEFVTPIVKSFGNPCKEQSGSGSFLWIVE